MRIPSKIRLKILREIKWFTVCEHCFAVLWLVVFILFWWATPISSCNLCNLRVAGNWIDCCRSCIAFTCDWWPYGGPVAELEGLPRVQVSIGLPQFGVRILRMDLSNFFSTSKTGVCECTLIRLDSVLRTSSWPTCSDKRTSKRFKMNIEALQNEYCEHCPFQI